MKRWNSVADLVKELGLTADPEDQEAVETALKREQSGLHPDKVGEGGEFETAEKKERFILISEALEFLESGSPPSTALVPIDALPALIKTLQDTVARSGPGSLAEAKADFRGLARSETNARFALPKISSAAVAAICSALLAFPGSVTENPIIGPLVGPFLGTTAGRVLFLGLLELSGIFFVFSWISEQRENGYVQWLATEEGLRSVLAQVLERRNHGSQEEPVTFTLSDVTTAILNSRRQRGLFLLRLGGGLSVAAAEQLAKVHVGDLEQRGIITRGRQRRLDTVFEIERTIAEDLSHTRL